MSMILRQSLGIDDKGTVRLRNTFDIGAAKGEAREAAKEGGRHGRYMRLMGFIPPEMWAYDPWLVAAKSAAQKGDKYEQTKCMRKFFELHPALAVPYEKRMF